MKHEKTNEGLVSLIGFLRKYSHEKEAPIWRDIAIRLEKPRRTWAVVNVSKLDRYAEANETIAVPGALLGAGELTKPLTVAAAKMSEQARDKIVAAGGSVTTLHELALKKPKGQGVRIMG